MVRHREIVTLACQVFVGLTKAVLSRLRADEELHSNFRARPNPDFVVEEPLDSPYVLAKRQ